MGRQIAIAMDHEDEETFLAYIRRSAGIDLYRSWSPEPESVASFTQEATASTFWLHNRAFAWKPAFEEVAYKDQATDEPGTYFRLITRHAPLLEYSRHSIGALNPQVAGRLYWAKLFVSQPHEITYDLVAFDAWFTSVAKWVRKNGTKILHGTTEPWCLPGARRAIQNAL